MIQVIDTTNARKNRVREKVLRKKPSHVYDTTQPVRLNHGIVTEGGGGALFYHLKQPHIDPGVPEEEGAAQSAASLGR